MLPALIPTLFALVPTHWSVPTEQLTEPGVGWGIRGTKRCQNLVGSRGSGFCLLFRPLSPWAVTREQSQVSWGGALPMACDSCCFCLTGPSTPICQSWRLLLVTSIQRECAVHWTLGEGRWRRTRPHPSPQGGHRLGRRMEHSEALTPSDVIGAMLELIAGVTENAECLHLSGSIPHPVLSFSLFLNEVAVTVPT